MHLPLFVINDSAENESGADATLVGTAGGGRGAVNNGDDPNGALELDIGGVGRPKEPGTRFDEGDEDALESGGHEGVFGYARLETGYVEGADDAIGAPEVLLKGVSNEGELENPAADGGITEDPGVDAVDFADKLLTL